MPTNSYGPIFTVNPVVTIFKDSDYQGASKPFPVGRYTYANLGEVGNDAVTSLHVANTLKVYLYEHDNFAGRVMTCVRHTPFVGKDVNDKISSLVVEERKREFVILYQDSGFQGWSQELGTVSLKSLSIGNDAVSSVIVPPGYHVKLYKDADFTGQMVELYWDASSLGSFNDCATCVVVEKAADAPAPTLDQLKQLIQQVAPRLYLHPSDEFGPSSVEWFLQRATLKGTDGTNRKAGSAPLPSGGSDDGAYWLEIDSSDRGGDLSSAVAYVNAKCYSSCIDLQFWFFYPYNGAGKAKLTVTGVDYDLPLDPMGEHGGDWEHITCRVELATKKLVAVYLAQHDSGEWVLAKDMTMENGHPVVFSSRHGHASYKSASDNLTNQTTEKELGVVWFKFALRNDTQKGSKVLDCATKYQIVGASFLGDQIKAPDWMSYCRRWGPHITYDTDQIKREIAKTIGDKATSALWRALPDECKEENGPTGAWRKEAWTTGF